MKLQAHHRTLDKWFSLYIRKRDTPGFCCTCGADLTFETSDCGHFISRDHIATRWDERNAHAQCRKCNRFQSGKQYEHGKWVDRIHGKGTADILLWKSKAPAKISKDEILAMTKRYRLIVKEGAF
jgi:NMD protein affecting ribosome stability and mRNA decay